MRLAMYQPDIPQNLGAVIRLCACFAVPLDIIEPCGFPLTDRSLKRAALDYGSKAQVQRHHSFTDFLASLSGAKQRLIAIETDSPQNLFDFAFRAEDVLLLGRESAGTPETVLASAQARLAIPMAAGLRSFNVVSAGAIALAEALRSSGALAKLWPSA